MGDLCSFPSQACGDAFQGCIGLAHHLDMKGLFTLKKPNKCLLLESLPGEDVEKLPGQRAGIVPSASLGK